MIKPKVEKNNNNFCIDDEQALFKFYSYYYALDEISFEFLCITIEEPLRQGQKIVVNIVLLIGTSKTHQETNLNEYYYYSKKKEPKCRKYLNLYHFFLCQNLNIQECHQIQNKIMMMKKKIRKENRGFISKFILSRGDVHLFNASIYYVLKP